MSEITLHADAAPGLTIHVKWADHNNIPHETTVNIAITERDKPRTLAVKVDGEVVCSVVSQHYVLPARRS